MLHPCTTHSLSSVVPEEVFWSRHVDNSPDLLHYLGFHLRQVLFNLVSDWEWHSSWCEDCQDQHGCHMHGSPFKIACSSAISAISSSIVPGLEELSNS